jgi:hypothetical protein
MDFQSFSELRQQFFSPGHPIDSLEHLKGREAQVSQILRNLDSPGRQVFIFGDRGVGKTSLAKTTALMAPGYNFDPVYVACDREGNFFQLAAAIIDELAGRMDQSVEKTAATKRSLLLKVLGRESSSSETRVYPEFSSLSQFVQALKALTHSAPKPPIIVIDELERFEIEHDKALLADLVKRISDDKINVSIIVCGIAASLTELIGIHPSAERSFSPIELKPLRHNNLWEIINSASSAFKVNIPEGLVKRIGMISDGFPYYTQLIGEQLFWMMWEDSIDVENCTSSHFQGAIDRSVEEALFTLREKYDKATLKYRNTGDFKHTLWAWVASPTLSRQVSDVYERSYLSISDSVSSSKILTSHEFSSRTWYLTQESHGNILHARGGGWYEFSENMMRGYVRLKAAEEKVQLEADIHKADLR